MLQSGAGEGEVSIVAWAGYIERGETDKATTGSPSSRSRATGCKVTVKTAATSDEMVALMNEGGFDLVTASGDASLRLIAGKRVQPINTDADPELVDARSAASERALAHGRRRPLRHALPVWGANVLMYNTERVQGHAPDQLERGVRGDRPCPTASPTRAACRPMTARSTSPTRRSI
jgi:putative spermidine/putrescine transport system substrate-binding protein